MLETGERLERDALAACVAHPTLVHAARRARPGALRVGAHRRFRDQLVDGGEPTASSSALRAELDARAAREGIDERTGKELLLRLRERRLRKDAHARPILDANGGRGGDRAGSRRRSKSCPSSAPSDATIRAAFPRSSIGRASGC